MLLGYKKLSYILNIQCSIKTPFLYQRSKTTQLIPSTERHYIYFCHYSLHIFVNTIASHIIRNKNIANTFALKSISGFCSSSVVVIYYYALSFFHAALSWCLDTARLSLEEVMFIVFLLHITCYTVWWWDSKGNKHTIYLYILEWHCIGWGQKLDLPVESCGGNAHM